MLTTFTLLMTVLLAPLAALRVAAAVPAELWVAQGGSDLAGGTPTAPLATIQWAIELAAPGTVITVGPGVFRERLVLRKSGEAGLSGAASASQSMPNACRAKKRLMNAG